MTHSERMVRFSDADLYVVITEAFCGGRSALEVLESVLDAGVTLIQFREKDCDDATLYTRALAFRNLIADRALMIVDDRVDIALAVGADGVHLGQSDMPIDVARRVVPDLIIGGSTHNLDEAVAAQQGGASYVNIGPVFATQTKRVASGVVGLEMIDLIRPHLSIPFTTMGGIKLHNIGEVAAHGARHAAVVTAVTEADDVCAAASALRAAIVKNRT